MYPLFRRISRKSSLRDVETSFSSSRLLRYRAELPRHSVKGRHVDLTRSFGIEGEKKLQYTERGTLG